VLVAAGNAVLRNPAGGSRLTITQVGGVGWGGVGWGGVGWGGVGWGGVGWGGEEVQCSWAAQQRRSYIAIHDLIPLCLQTHSHCGVGAGGWGWEQTAVCSMMTVTEAGAVSTQHSSCGCLCATTTRRGHACTSPSTCCEVSPLIPACACINPVLYRWWCWCTSQVPAHYQSRHSWSALVPPLTSHWHPVPP
jgi:hypothetical protein